MPEAIDAIIPIAAAHRAGNDALDTEICRRANNCIGNRTGALTTAGDEWTAAGCSGKGV